MATVRSDTSYYTYYDWGYSVQQTSDGGYIVAGKNGNSDVYLVKADSGGNETWSRSFGGASTDIVFSVQQTSDGGYIITGYRDSYGTGYFDVYLIKTDPNGYVQ